MIRAAEARIFGRTMKPHIYYVAKITEMFGTNVKDPFIKILKEFGKQVHLSLFETLENNDEVKACLINNRPVLATFFLNST